jgi:dipeptidyl aminopeptidase/acylaminoacyl peptidase
MKRGLHSARALYESASPVYHIGPEAPPFLVIHGRRDTLAPVEQSRRFVTELGAVSSAPALYLELPAAQHAFDLFPSVRVEAVLEGIRRFLAHAAGASAGGQEGLGGELGAQEAGLGVDHEPDGDGP